MASEFELIRRFFDRPARRGARTLLGVGDDAALLRVEPGMALAVSTDMLLAGRHFPEGTAPGALGHKALAVNLSDLAAMGATPRWATLAIALPVADEGWLSAFSAGLFALAQRFDVDLVGGDTTRGPLAISVTVLGEVPAEHALTRGGARPGDDIWVSGVLGQAAAGLAERQGQLRLAPQVAAPLRARLEMPEPRIVLGERLRGIASAAIDVSDGFAADLGHVLERSGVGALVHYAQLPGVRTGDAALDMRCVLAGGDDYELIFTAGQEARAAITALAGALDISLSRVGAIQAAPMRLVLLDAQGGQIAPPAGYDHFADLD
ncbi:MAG: thiamine monophosphate kinase [Betaproteobacteria bacterium SG8_39]|nr:MAG: thiamine monophosphate kinase [Betaproteobacteria bacterium SG8_39]